MKNNPYPNVTAYKDRHGKTRHRFRCVGMPNFSFTTAPGTEEFTSEYALACAGRAKPKRRRKSPPKIKPELEPSLKQFKGASVVYVVGHQYGPVKIGWSTDVHARLKDLQTAQHRPLKVMAILDGGEELERDLHQRFRDRRIRGEWFRWDADVSGHISALLANQNSSSPTDSQKPL